MVTIIIPSYKEVYLKRTLQDILEKAKGEIEIIVNIDGGEKPDINDNRITYVVQPKPIGMRGGINYGIAHAKGKYLMKIDAHCCFDEGFDLKLKENMQENWLVIPRRYALHAEKWDKVETRPIKDYHFLSCPQIESSYGKCMFPVEWRERMKERFGKPEYNIDDTMTFQGSCWFANRAYFMQRVGYLDDNDSTYSTFSGEQVEVGMKYWMGGGEVKVNKNTWYAHLYKNKRYYGTFETEIRDYKRDLKNKAGYEWATNHWMYNKEPNMKRTFEWLMDKFWPVPTWPDNWKEIYYK